MDFLPSINTVGGLVALILGFGFIVFVHELGHFLVAKAVGIKVTQFAIGFGHSIFAWRKGIGVRVGTTEPEYARRIEAYLRERGIEGEASQSQAPDEDGAVPTTATPEFSTRQINEAADALGLGETEYRLNYLPLGGYVKMLGQEDIDPAARSDDPRSYTSRPVWARMLVISAGVVMNLIFAMIFFIIAFMVGVNFPPAEVGEVVPGMPAALTYAVGHEGDSAYRGLQYGDVIQRINGEEPMDHTDVRLASALSGEGDKIHLVVHRPSTDETLEFYMTPVVGPEGLYVLGFSTVESLELVEFADREDWPAPFDALNTAGVKFGMKAVALNGQPISEAHELVRPLKASPGEAFTVTFKDEKTGETVGAPVAAEPLFVPEKDQPPQVLGVVPGTLVRGVRDDTPAKAADVRPGDVIARAGDTQWPDMQQLPELVEAAQNGLEIDVFRDGQIVRLGTIKPENGQLGIEMKPALRVSKVLPDSPFAALNLSSGTELIALNGQPLNDMYDLAGQVADAKPGDKLNVTFEIYVAGSPIETEAIEVDEASLAATSPLWWRVNLPFVQKETLIRTDSPIVAARYGLVKTEQTMISVYVTLARLVQGRVPASELRGPIGIGHIGTIIARDRGITYLIFFLGLISVNLAVVNFLPIPVVDGGHMVFLITEWLKGSPVDPRVQIGATYVGLALILCVFVFTFYNDVARLITGG